MKKSRELTKDEVEEMFLAHVARLAKDWESSDRKTVAEKLSGLAFSILVLLDGEACDLPGFTVSPRSSKGDKKFYASHGENWFPKRCDIGGGLHERFYSVYRKLTSGVKVKKTPFTKIVDREIPPPPPLPRIVKFPTKKELEIEEDKGPLIMASHRRFHTWKCEQCGSADLRTREPSFRRPCPHCGDKGDKIYVGFIARRMA